MIAEESVRVPVRPSILHLEDSLLDAELVAEYLRNDGIVCDIRRVSTSEAFVDAVDRGGFDIILADHQLPGFDGDAALAIARERAPTIPFVFVSGTLGEDVAVEALKRGATDYVIKQRLDRLGGVVLRALDEYAARSERDRAENALREGDARLRALTDQLPGGMVYQVAMSRDGSGRRYLYVSNGFERMTGIPAAALLADPNVADDHLPQEDRDRFAAVESDAVSRLVPFDIQLRFLRGDGDTRWLRTIASPRVQSDGSLIWDGIQIDITDQKRTEMALLSLNETLERDVQDRTAALAASEARMRSMIETSYQYQALLSPDGSLLYANGESLAGIGCTLDQLIGCKYWDTPWFAATPGMADVVRTVVADVAAGGCIRRDICLDLPTGQRWFDFSMRPIRGEDGGIVGLIPEALDTTDRHLAEETLRQSQKLEAMGQLTGGVAHDFNNLLTPIIGSLDLMQRHGLGDERHQRLIRGALESAERARTLVQRLLAFARRQPLQLVSVELDRLIRDVAGLVTSAVGPRIAIAIEIEPGVAPAMADANQLEMAILNLAVNARDAMPDGGRLTIALAMAHMDGGHETDLPAGDYVCLSVVDTGLGMDAETLAKSIEPFFSTKGIGKGTGLGLSMVHGLALQLGGALVMESSPGVGTRATLWLPVSCEAARAGDVEATDAPGQDGRAGAVLVVDDEPLVRAATSDMLTDLGFVVTGAGSAEEALHLLESGNRFDLLVTDHLMSGMSGADLAHIARKRWPDMDLLLVSGYAEAAALDATLPKLSKPFRQADLTASLAAARSR